MEIASEALMMAFGVLIFVLALTVAITSFSQAREVSDAVLYTADETNYYDYQEATGKASQNRIVGLETIIPTLYKYYKEDYTVLFRHGNYDESTGELSNVQLQRLYTTASEYKKSGVQIWSKNYDDDMKIKYSPYISGGYSLEGSKEIFSFDLDEETARKEPWTGRNDQIKLNLDCFLNGKIYYNPNDNSKYIDYKNDSSFGNGGFIKYCIQNKCKFVETIGEYTFSSSQSNGTEDGSTVSSLVKPKKKRVIIYTKIDN